MPGINQPHDEYLARLLDDLDRRISELETTPALNFAQIAKGVLQVVDAAGNVRVQLGLIPDGLGTYGFRTLLPGGTELFRTDDRGVIAPPEYVPVRPLGTVVGNSIPVTSASLVDVFSAHAYGTLLTEGIVIAIPWSTDAGTTGALVVRSDAAVHTVTPPNTPTSSIALPAGSSGVHALHWLPGYTLPVQDAIFYIQAQLTGGAGNVNVYWPEGGVGLVGPVGMAANGGWT